MKYATASALFVEVKDPFYGSQKEILNIANFLKMNNLFRSVFSFSQILSTYRTYSPHTEIKHLEEKKANDQMREVETEVFREIARAFNTKLNSQKNTCSVHVRLYEEFDGEDVSISGTLFQGYLDVRMRLLSSLNDPRARKIDSSMINEDINADMKDRIPEHFLLASIQHFFSEMKDDELERIVSDYIKAHTARQKK